MLTFLINPYPGTKLWNIRNSSQFDILNIDLLEKLAGESI